jgi:hypothetical protein
VKKKSLKEKYSPSSPCACVICLSYCIRPGWWTVDEAAQAIDAGFAARMMVEVSPERTFLVLAPAFRGCEGNLALGIFKDRGCTFLKEGRCELHGSGFQPLECRFCHHDRPGQGPACHADIEKDWDTPVGQALVERWSRKTGFFKGVGRSKK